MARLDKRNVTRYWWDQHVPGLSLLHADFTSHDYPAHAHDAFVIAVTELLYSAQIIYARTYEIIQLLIVASIWYLIVTTVLSFGQYHVERYFGRGVSRNQSDGVLRTWWSNVADVPFFRR